MRFNGGRLLTTCDSAGIPRTGRNGSVLPAHREGELSQNTFPSLKIRMTSLPKNAKQREIIPLFSCDGVRVDRISLARLTVLQELGRISRLVTHRKGYINGAFLARLHTEPRPTTIGSYAGTRYGFRQRLSDGHVTYRLRALGDHPFGSERDLAPDCTRPIFLRVLRDCMELPERAHRCAPRGNVHRGARDAARANVGPSAADCASV